MMKIKQIIIRFSSVAYKVIKEIVLIIFRFSYDIVKNLGKFLFIMLILIIAFVATFAEYLNEEEMETPKQMDTLESFEESPKQIKSHRLLEYNEDSDTSYTPNDVEEEKASAAEVIAYEAVSSNVAAFYKNSLLQVYPDAEVLVVHTGKAADLANNIQTKAEALTAELMEKYRDHHYKNRFAFDINDTASDIEDVRNMFQSAGSVASSEDMDRIVGMIRNGSQITILTPSDSSEASFENDPQNSPVTPKEQLVVEQSKPAVIIVTKRVEEGEPLPPLPDWVDSGYTHKDFMIRRKRLDNMFNSDYVNTHKDKTKPSDKNQDWLYDGEEDLNFDVALGIDPERDSDKSSKTK